MRMAKHHFPSNTDLIEELDEIEKLEEWHGRLQYWCEECDRRHDPHQRWYDILDRWLAAVPTISRLRMVAAALQQRGRREELQVLTKYHISGEQDSVDQTVADARFGVMRRSLE